MAEQQSICLNMIVRNERKVIRRCLESVRPFITHFAIVDTGSTDGTQALIRELLADLPGQLIERPWVDFGTNRTEALELARDRAEYIMVIDADEVMRDEPGSIFPRLTSDLYATRHTSERNWSYYLPQFLKNGLPWRYVGVLHEHVACEVSHTKTRLNGVVCYGAFDGARNEDPKTKYENDAAILEQALRHEPDNARYRFYLAQSYFACERYGAAKKNFDIRAQMAGWEEEVWYSLFQSAVMKKRLGHDFAEVQDGLLQAYQYRPTRAEPLCALASHYREQRQYVLAYLFAKQAANIPPPDDELFLNEEVYAWKAKDELSIAAYYVGKPQESLQLAEELLSGQQLPEAERSRVEENVRFARDAITLQTAAT